MGWARAEHKIGERRSNDGKFRETRQSSSNRGDIEKLSACRLIKRINNLE